MEAQESLFPNLPPRLIGRGELAENLWWSWHPAARILFKMLSRRVWKETSHNPDKLLKDVPQAALESAANDPEYLRHFDQVLSQFRKDIVQMSDLNTQEHASLKGGRQFEPERENSAFELHGLSRYLSNHYREVFALECQAVKRAREEMGLTNISIMIPRCPNLEEADGVLKALEEEGLVRGKEGLQLHLSCDYESNVNDAKALVTRFDGIAIAAQRLCRMALARKGVPARNSPRDAKASNDSLREILNLFVTSAHAAGRTVTVRGRNSRELQDLIGLLLELNVGAISVNPEAMPMVRRWVAEAEQGRTS